MISYYLKTILLSLNKSGRITAFNIFGLTISFAAFILLTIYIVNELTYDHNNTKHQNIYMLSIKGVNNGEPYTSTLLPNPLADLLDENIPELKSLCSFAYRGSTYSKKGIAKSYDIKTRGVDSTFTDIFTVNIKTGNPHPLRGKNKIILSEKAAYRMFGNENPVGKTIFRNFDTPYYVEAVYYNLPANSSLKNYGAFCSFPTDIWINDWTEWSFNHFYTITANTNFKELNTKINENQTIKETLGGGEFNKVNFEFIPLANLHFNANTGTGNKPFVNTLILISFLILLMAFVNYLNFAFANAPKLIKSVNIRSVVGESRKRLLVLSMAESVVLTTISFAFALLICVLLVALMPNLLGFTVQFYEYKLLLVSVFILLIIAGIVVSFFPSRLITKVNPASALKGLIPFSAQKGKVGKALTVIQYTISIILIIGILFIEKQIDFVKNYDLGFEKDNIVVIETTLDIRKQEQAFVDELLNNPKISNYAFSQFVPGGVGMGWGRDVDGKTVNFKCWPIDERYLDFMGFDIVEGRTFSSNINADEDKFIFNETAIKTFGWQDNALGKLIPGFGFEGELIGVVKDIKFASLYQNIQPMAFWLTKTRHNRLSLKISGTDVSSTLKHIEETYNKFEKQFPFDYQFLDKSLDQKYKSTEKQAKMIFIFCLISLFVSIIGALGMVLFMCEYRIKEIGIRKVNGARIFEVMAMLNKSFIKWVIIAFIIASPLAFFIMNKWLENFAYKTTLSWWVFALAGCLAFGIALLTVSWQTYRAARRNPVEALRYE